ncbi:MAG: transcriptional repressor LexA [Planctomycetota bacterium]|nr:transcriptional repressor LexA [Planctomycetota bacterium]
MYFTEKQLRIMEFIQQFREERGISPTLDEIASNFGVTKITVYEHVNQLERKGALKREKFRARSIELLAPVEERKARYSMPLMGNFREGLPIEATEEREDLNISEMLPYGRNFFALRVRGNELTNDHLTDGDLIIAEKREMVDNGDVVVAVLNGGKACLKKFYREEDQIRLQSPNGSMESEMVTHADIRGVVVGILRRFDETSI